jgi:hypothetical protein
MAKEISQGGFEHRDRRKAALCPSRHLDLVVDNAKARKNHDL